jgi:lipoyl(octanoyl) transferase
VAYVRQLEDVVIAAGGLPGSQHREPRYTGVWVGDEKIAAIGVEGGAGSYPPWLRPQRRSRLSMFGHIVPCGIRDRGVTSMAAQLGAAADA